jgi:5,6,7,8-tetrahydromethanopterin hydro-lyase
VRPFTLFVNKAAVEGEQHATLTWGAAHAGVAAGVMAAVAEGTVPEGEVAALLLIAAVWVSPEAADERAVFENNREATLGALRAGREGLPSVAEALAVRDAPHNAYYRP